MQSGAGPDVKTTKRRQRWQAFTVGLVTLWVQVRATSQQGSVYVTCSAGTEFTPLSDLQIFNSFHTPSRSSSYWPTHLFFGVWDSRREMQGDLCVGGGTKEEKFMFSFAASLLSSHCQLESRLRTDSSPELKGKKYRWGTSSPFRSPFWFSCPQQRPR